MPTSISNQSGSVEFKAISGQINVDEAKGIVECFVSGVGNKDSVGDIVLPGAFTESLKRRKPRVVWGHDWNHPIGKVLEIYEVPASDPRLPAKMKAAGIGGLFARVQFNLKSEKGKEAFANVAFYGEEQEWSIGYKTLDAIYDNQRQANLLREVELYEVSPVLHGANQLTGTISIKSEEGDQKVDSFGKSKWKMFDREFAARLKQDYPEIWAKGGNIKGNAQYAILTKIAEQGGSADTPDQTSALELREAWVARHAGDFRLPGVIAQIKWLAIGSRGEDYMKNVVREAMKKIDMKRKSDEEVLDESEMGQEKGHMMMAMSPAMSMMRSLVAEIGKRFGGPVRMRQVSKNQVIFDHLHDGKPMTMRVGYHYEDGQFMFGDPVKVVARTVYMEVEDGDEEAGYGNEYEGDDEGEEREYPKPSDYEDDDEDEYRKGSCSCGGKSLNYFANVDDFLDSLEFDAKSYEQKAGRVISSGNLEKLQRAVEILQEIIAAGGRAEIEMKEQDDTIIVEAKTSDLFDLRSFIDPVLEYHELDAEVDENGINVKVADFSQRDAIEQALTNAVINFYSSK
jgi:HK97 family phage prohead protease